MMDVRVLHDLEEVRRLREEWDDLHRRAAPDHPFLAPAWVLNWWSAYGTDAASIRFVTVRSHGGLVGVAPLRLGPEWHWGRVRPTLRLWADAYANRAGPLLDPGHRDEALAGIAEGIARDPDWELAALEPVELAHPSIEGLALALEDRGIPTGLEAGYTSPYMVPPEGVVDPMDAVSRAYRRTLRRKLNRARRAGCVVSEPGPGSGMEAAFAVSRASWQHRNGTGLDTTSENEAFFRGMAADPWLRERLRILVLSRDGRPVAYDWNVRYGRRLYNLKVGYREDEADLSPGIVLRHHAVEGVLDEGLREFDFLGDVEPYKMHWATGVRPHGTLFAFRGGVRLRLVHAVRHRLRPALRRSPLLVRAVRVLRGRGRGSP
ncbi:MAG TPA: GNAT family N-acetyltransferase [Longimicrobiales bacterium]|nr:GNAT family N-acetyltransferase [Longimicrobiales bacterium]